MTTQTAGDIRRQVLAQAPSASRDLALSLLAWLGPDDHPWTDADLEAVGARILADSIENDRRDAEDRARRKYLARRQEHLLHVVRAIMERERDRRAATDPDVFYIATDGRKVARFERLPSAVQCAIRAHFEADRAARMFRAER